MLDLGNLRAYREVLVLFYPLLFGGRVSLLCSPGCQGTYYVYQAGLKLRNLAEITGVLHYAWLLLLLILISVFSEFIFKKMQNFMCGFITHVKMHNMTLKKSCECTKCPCFMRNCHPKFCIKGLFSHVSLS